MEMFLLGLTPFIVNALMGVSKWLVASDWTTGWKRGLLAVFAILGALSVSALTGTSLDANAITSWVQVILESFIVFVTAHGTYTLFWQKPAVQ